MTHNRFESKRNLQETNKINHGPKHFRDYGQTHVTPFTLHTTIRIDVYHVCSGKFLVLVQKHVDMQIQSYK